MANQFSVFLRGAGATENRLHGNRIGIGANGADLGGSFGVFLIDSPNNVIGGMIGSEGNLFTAELAAIGINGAGSKGNRIQGNRIGHAASRNVKINRFGIGLTGGSNTTIGGAGALGNRIASNFASISADGETAITELVIEGNEIGLNEAGEAVNGTVGIFLDGTEGQQVKKAGIRGNRVAGHKANIMLAGEGVDGTVPAGQPCRL